MPFFVILLPICLRLSWISVRGQLVGSPAGSLFSQALADHAAASGSAAGNGNSAQDLFPQSRPFKPAFHERLTCDGVFQDYCSKPGQNYPRTDIGYFIDENKAMMKRMFGSVSSRSLLRKDEEDQGQGQAAMDNSDLRKKRMAKAQHQLTTYLCPVEEELVTPFWAVNGTGVKLAIVNSPPFEQAIHTVKCARALGTTAGGVAGAGQTNQRCHPNRPCWCAQEYSWFRLLAYDPNDNCKGIFMDWFKFPSHCACKCVQAATVNALAVAAAVASAAAPVTINPQ